MPKTEQEKADAKQVKQLDKRREARGRIAVPALVHVQYDKTVTTRTTTKGSVTTEEYVPAYGLDRYGQLWRYFPRQEYEDGQTIPAKWIKNTVRAEDGTTHYPEWTPDLE